MIVTITIFFLINLILAFIDSRLIGKKRKILHGVNGFVYLLIIALPVFSFNNYWLIGVLLFERLLVFNIALSLFRGLKWNYISAEPKAITDKIAKFVFGMKGKLMYAVYLLIFITLLYFTFYGT